MESLLEAVRTVKAPTIPPPDDDGTDLLIEEGPELAAFERGGLEGLWAWRLGEMHRDPELADFRGYLEGVES